MKMKPTNTGRGVAGVSTGPRGGRGTGGGRGRGGRGGGRGGNSGRGGGGKPAAKARVHAGHYELAAWKDLTEDEQQKVYKLREEKKRKAAATASQEPAAAAANGKKKKKICLVSTTPVAGQAKKSVGFESDDKEEAQIVAPTIAPARSTGPAEAVKPVVAVDTRRSIFSKEAKTAADAAAVKAAAIRDALSAAAAKIVAEACDETPQLAAEVAITKDIVCGAAGDQFGRAAHGRFANNNNDNENDE
jgi:hypothetical protein